MEVKIFKWANVESLYSKNVIMSKAFNDFRHQLKYCDWRIPSDIAKSFRTSDIVTCAGKPFNRVIFDIGGNKYRLICGYKFGKSKVVLYVRFAGTHKEYDRIKDPCKIDQFA